MEGEIEMDPEPEPFVEQDLPVVVTPPAKRNGKRPPPPSSTASNVGGSSVIQQAARSDQETVREWFEALGGTPDAKVNISRKRPFLGPKGEQIGGSLETVDGEIDEDYIREQWGGGEYQLKLLMPKGNGQMKWSRGMSLKIAGPPKMFGRELGDAAVAVVTTPAEDSMGERAFRSMEALAREERARADEARKDAARPAPGLDIGAIQAFNAPLLAQLTSANDTIRDLQSQLRELANKAPPRDEFRDSLMQQMIHGENARLEALRLQYENRIDKLKDNHDDELKRIDARHRDELNRLTDGHQRELKYVEKSGETGSSVTKQAFETRIDTQKDTIAKLERELTTAHTKIAALEAKKDMSIGEKADELIKVKEALDGLGGSDGDDKDSPWYQRLIEAAGNSEAALALIGKLSGGPPNQQQQQQPQQQVQLPPPGVPYQTGDGNIYVRDQHGNVSIIDQSQLRRQRQIEAVRQRRQQPQGPKPPKPTAAQVAAVQGGGTSAEPPQQPDEDDEESELEAENAEDAMLELDENDVKIALSFMENAIKNGTPPDKFAQSARSLVPGSVISFLQQFGVRKLLGMVKLDAHSPLTSVKGRQYAEAVSKVLIGDV